MWTWAVLSLKRICLTWPLTQRWKRQALAAARIPVPANVTFVPADLATGSLDALLPASRFDPAQPALVSWLGVTMYLTRDAISHTLTAISTFAPGTELITDYMLPASLRDTAANSYAELVGAVAAERGEPDWLRAERIEAWKGFEALPMEGNQLYTPYLDLRDADLSMADLTAAVLVAARLDGATVRDADLTRADLRRASVDRVDLASATLKETRIDLPAAVMLAELQGAIVDLGE